MIWQKSEFKIWVFLRDWSLQQQIQVPPLERRPREGNAHFCFNAKLRVMVIYTQDNNYFTGGIVFNIKDTNLYSIGGMVINIYP